MKRKPFVPGPILTTAAISKALKPGLEQAFAKIYNQLGITVTSETEFDTQTEAAEAAKIFLPIHEKGTEYEIYSVPNSTKYMLRFFKTMDGFHGFGLAPIKREGTKIKY